MRSDCCTDEVSFSIWAKRTYYSFWDVVNRKKWLRPLYRIHYRILCLQGQDDWEDTPGLYDDDFPLNPEKFIDACRAERTDEQILLNASFEAEVMRFTTITNDIGIRHTRLMHEKDEELGRYYFYLFDVEATPEQMERLARLSGYDIAFDEEKQLMTVDLNGRLADWQTTKILS